MKCYNLFLTCFVTNFDCSDVIIVGVGRGRKLPLPHPIIFRSDCVLVFIHSAIDSKCDVITNFSS